MFTALNATKLQSDEGIQNLIKIGKLAWIGANTHLDPFNLHKIRGMAKGFVHFNSSDIILEINSEIPVKSLGDLGLGVDGLFGNTWKIL